MTTRFGELNLQLLVILDELLRQRSITKTAQRLYLSQPSVSVALKRLRAHYEDELLVRMGGGLVLTDLAIELQPLIREALEHVEGIVDYRRSFDPSTSTRRFVIEASAPVRTILFGPLMNRLEKTAPHVRVQFMQTARRIGHPLDSGSDLTIMGFPFGEDYVRQFFFSDTWCGIVGATRSKSPRRLSIPEWLEVKWVTDPFSCMRDYHPDLTIEQRSLFRGITDPVGVPDDNLYTGNPLSAALSVVGTDYAAYVPRTLAEHMVAIGQFRIIEPPVAAPKFSEYICWSPSRNGDAGLAWLRSLCFKSIEGSSEQETA